MTKPSVSAPFSTALSEISELRYIAPKIKFGYVFAYTVTRVNVPAKGFFKTMATLPILSPPFVLSLSIIFLFGKQGLISKNLLGITGSSVYGLKSLIVVQVMSFFPIAYLTLSGILASIDASVEDAACNMGASRWHTFWTVTF
ncbi:ABC transporter permease, partial [Phascolarctobacterium faecium]|uniref:ABC transporter permease n=1 Tax=Phascolarctobacterium faecium TaxID=33025 RepID=UPI00307D61B1